MSGPLTIALGLGWTAMFVSVVWLLSREASRPIEPQTRTDAELLAELMDVRHELEMIRPNLSPNVRTDELMERYKDLCQRNYMLTLATGLGKVDR